jgi:hypothetical protein
MDISIQQLLSSHCGELNQIWCDSFHAIEDPRIDQEALKPFIDRFREAEREGYVFEPISCPLTLISLACMDSPYENEMTASPKWRDIRIISNMQEQARENGWHAADRPLRELSMERIRSISGPFLQQYVLKHGPFFLSKDPSRILVFCNMGSAAHDVTLLMIVKSKAIEDEASGKHG